MAIPTKEELKAQRELKEYLKTLSKDSEVFTGLTAGLGFVGRGVSTASKVAKTVKNSKRGKDVFNQLASKLKSFQSTAKKAKSTVKEVVEKKPTIPTTVPTSGSTVSDKIKSLYDQLSSGKPKQSNILESVKNVRELAEKQVKNAPITTTNAPVAKELWKKPLPTPSYTNDGFRIGGTEAKSILSNLKDKEAARKAAKEAYEKSKAIIIKQGIEESNRKIVDKAISIGAISGLLGGGTAATYYGMQLSNKDNKKTTTPQKTGPVDLKRINPSKLKPSSIPGVSITKAMVNGKEKEFGIVWDNKTQSWDYYRGNKTTETPKPDLKREDVGGGYTPIKDNKGSGSGGKTTTGGGTGTTPRSATGQSFDKAFAEARKQAGGAGGIFEWNGKKYGTALRGETVPKDRVEVGKTTAPLMGDEEYKKDPRLAILRQQDDDRQLLARAEAQKKEMKEFKPTESLDVLPVPTKPLSSLMFKTSSLNPKTNSRVEPVSYDTIDIVDTKSKKLRKKSYGGNLAMLKYMKQ